MRIRILLPLLVTLLLAGIFALDRDVKVRASAPDPNLPAAVPVATPVASSFSTAVPANRQTAMTLLGSDPDSTPLTYAIGTGPTNGTLSGLNTSTGVVIYTPVTNYTGADSFTYTVTSGSQTSPAGTVTLTVTNAKTRIVDTIVDSSGGPRQGKVTFILTQPVTTPAGISPAGASVSASLNPAGRFDISVYPSKSLQPNAYYQVWFADSATLNREMLGIYEIPLATTTIVLAPYKVTDTNLAARYTFASEASVSALQLAVATATLQSLLGSSTNNVLQKYDAATGKLANSNVSNSGTTATVTGDLAVTGNVSATNFIGDGSGLTGIGSGTGGVINTGSTTIGADSDANGVGKISLQIGGVEKASLENDGTFRGTFVGPESALLNGVRGDAVVVLDGAISATSATLTSASSNFPTSVVGLSIAVVGAGASGATLNTTIAARPSTTTLTLTVTASTTVSAARVIYGTDNGGPMQTALNAALAAGVRVVEVPRGLYFFPTGSIEIPQSVTLQGSFDIRSIHRGGGCGLSDPEYDPLEADATTFLITADEGSSSGYFMKTETNAAVKGVFVYYPAQIPSLVTPKSYPFTFELRGTGSHLEDVELGLAYQGVKVVSGIQQVVRNIAGQTLSIGLYATQILDSPLFEHIRFETFHSFLSDDPLNPAHGCAGSAVPLVQWMQANGVGYKFGRVDNGQAIDLMAFGYSVGMQLVVDPSNGDGPGGNPWVSFTGGDLEAAKPLIVDNTASDPNSTTNGVTFVNFAFGPNLTADNGILINATFTGRLSFTNCNVNGNVTNGLYYKQGATGWVSVIASEFQQWSSAGIRLEGTAAVGFGRATIIGNRFKSSTVPAVDISSRMSGVISGNIFANTFSNSVSSSSTLPFQYGPDLFSDGSVASYGKALRVNTPAAAGESLWSGNYRLIGLNTEGFQIAGGASVVSDGHHILQGAYFDGTNWKYTFSSIAPTNYTVGAGSHLFRVAPAGTAGNNITWKTGLAINEGGIGNFSYGASVASASSIAPTGASFTITGTTTISTISTTGINPGTVLNMITTSAGLVFDEAGNIDITNATSLTSTANGLVVSVWDGTKWRTR